MLSKLDLGERILLTLWIGGSWAVGYIAVPSLFANLEDRQLAGYLAGEMFRAIFSVGVICSILLLASVAVSAFNSALRSWRWWLLVAMLGLTLVSLFVLQPMMAELKAQREVLEAAIYQSRFGRLHGFSSALYLVISLAGLVLVVFGLRRPVDRI